MSSDLQITCNATILVVDAGTCPCEFPRMAVEIT
jgi:hypothetical protein